MFGAGTIIVSLALPAFILVVVHGEQYYYDDDDPSYIDEEAITADGYEDHAVTQEVTDYKTTAQVDYAEEYGEYDNVVVGLTTTWRPDPTTQKIDEATQASDYPIDQELATTTVISTTTIEPFLGIRGNGECSG